MTFKYLCNPAKSRIGENHNLKCMYYKRRKSEKKIQ